MDKLNESAEERLTSLESSQMQIQSDLRAFQEESGDNMKKILALLSAKQESSTAPPTTPKYSAEELTHKAVGWKVTVDLLQQELESKKLALADIDHLRETLELTTQEKSELEDSLAEVEKEKEQHKHEKELLQQRLVQLGETDQGEKKSTEFPSNETILHNLLVAQIEFYFSNHHLKRDKPLMEKLTEQPDVGFVSFDEVTSFPKVRTLGQTIEVVEKAVRASRHLVIKESKDGKLLVGREQFQPPRAQEFPFRRTVFVYGVPPAKAQTETWIREQFECFGNIAKVKFDSGPHSLPRKVGARLLSKETTRVVRLHMRDQDHTEYKFQKQSNQLDKQLTTYYCHECGKMKNYKDGYYVSDKRTQQGVFCVQCAAKRAESNLKYFQTRCHNHYMDSDSLKQLFGIDLNEYTNENLQSFRTCLVVFESQRQASKCVYVRSRLGIEGCFATHFHNYTRHKREISQGIELPEPSLMKQNSAFRLEPRRTMQPQRSVGARVEKSFARGIPGLTMPQMRKHQSTPTLGKNTRGSRRNNYGSHV